MTRETLPQPVDEVEQARLFTESGTAFLEQHGAADQANRVIEIVHSGGIYKGTIAQAIGGQCPEFRTMAESMIEVAGVEMLAPTIDKYVEKSELKKKS